MRTNFVKVLAISAAVAGGALVAGPAAMAATAGQSRSMPANEVAVACPTSGVTLDVNVSLQLGGCAAIPTVTPTASPTLTIAPPPIPTPTATLIPAPTVTLIPAPTVTLIPAPTVTLVPVTPTVPWYVTHPCAKRHLLSLLLDLGLVIG
ncbi:hypothetical protein [Microbispora sp. NPDC049125]|uniref:hypothetical protein n=1 Tax=Microbispora sp. NPDC049125 TaxID=3154929 RepID=UPI003465B788